MPAKQKVYNHSFFLVGEAATYGDFMNSEYDRFLYDVVKIDVPFFILWVQALTSVCICSALKLLHTSRVWKNSPISEQFSKTIAYELLPLSIIFCSMTAFNNISLKYLGVSFYYVARSLSTVFNVIFTYLILKTTTSMKACTCCFFLMIGYAVGSAAEANSGSLSYFGLVCGLAASACVALNAIFTRKYLTLVGENIWLLSWYNNVNSVLLLFPCIFVNGEHHALLQATSSQASRFLLVLTVSGFLGFAIGFMTGLQIKYTSPLTHNVSGTAKAAFQTVLGVAIYQEVKTSTWWFGNLLVLASSSSYAYVRHGEQKARRKESDTLPVIEEEKR